MQKDKILHYYNHIERHKKYEGKNMIKVRKMSVFRLVGNILRLELCWPPSIGADNSKVTSFDWALAGARSCPSIGQWQQQVVSFDWGLEVARCILQLG